MSAKEQPVQEAAPEAESVRVWRVAFLVGVPLLAIAINSYLAGRHIADGNLFAVLSGIGLAFGICALVENSRHIVRDGSEE